MALIRPRSSLFRPVGGIDQSPLHDHRALVADIERRKLLKGAISLGALAMLSGCDVTETESVQRGLRAVSSWNDRVQETLFRPNHLAPTYSEAEVLKPPRFNAFYGVEDVKPVDAKTWKLELAGNIRDRKPWTAEEIYALPEQEMIIRHICVEGWDYIGQWSGVNFRRFLETVGADLTAKYIAFHCADGYTECLDMPTALHPQTMLATKYGREILTDPFGFPLRLRTATKLGFKNAKWIQAIEVSNTFTETHFGKEGFNWVQRDLTMADLPQDDSPEARMNRRFPQKIRIGALVGLPVIDDDYGDLGTVTEVVRTPAQKILLIVRHGGVLGLFARKVAVPIEVVAILGKQVASIDMQPAAYKTAPTWVEGSDTKLGNDETIRIALTKR